MTEKELRAKYEKEMALRDQYDTEMAALDSAPAEEKDYLAETVMSPEFAQPGIPSEKSMASGLVGGANLLDTLSSPVRAGFSEMTQGQYIPTNIPSSMEEITAGPRALGRFAKGAGEQLIKNIRSPLTAPMQAPSMGDIFGKELRTKTIPNLLTTEAQKRQAETLGGFLGEVALPSFEFGAASAIGKGISKIPSGAAALGAGKRTLESFLSGSKEALKSVERKQIQHLIDNNITEANLKEGFAPKDISAIMVEENLTRHASSPKKMLDALEGSEKVEYPSPSPGLVAKKVVSKTPGLIKTKSDAMRAEITDLANKAGVEVQVPAFTIKQKLMDDTAIADPLSGVRYSPEIAAQREKILNEILKPYEEEWVPGIPLEAAKPSFRMEVPPPVPMGPPDRFPMQKQESLIPQPEFPPRPEFEGINIPEPLKAAEDINKMAGVPETPSKYNFIKTLPPKPEPPQSYGGIVSKEAQAQYETKLTDWEKESAKVEKDYASKVSEADKSDAGIRTGAERIRESLASDAIKEHETLLRDWEETVAKTQKEHASSIKNAKSYDDMVERAKIEHAADRFIERAKRNKAYKEKIMDVDEDYRQHLIESLNRKVFNKPRHWSLQDMLTLRTNVGERMSSPTFYMDTANSTEKDVLLSLYRNLREEISSKLEGIPTKIKNVDGSPMSAATYYDLQSDAIHRMIQAKTLLRKEVLKGNKAPDAAASIIALVTGGAMYGGATAANMMMGGNAAIPATALGIGAAAAGYGAAKSATPGVLASGANILRSGIGAAQRNPEPLARVLGAGSRKLRDNYVMENESKYPKVFGREPQSVDVQSIKIPRSVQGILQNKEAVLEKLAAQGISDNVYRAVAYGMNKSPKNLSNVLPLLMQEYPDMFEDNQSNYSSADDKYYNLLDGKFIDSNEAAAAADSISKRSDLSSVQRAKIINEINKNKKWTGN